MSRCTRKDSWKQAEAQHWHAALHRAGGGGTEGPLPSPPPLSAPTEHEAALLSECAPRGWLPALPLCCRDTGQLLCCGFSEPQEQNEACRNEGHDCFPEGSILRNSPAGCGMSLGFNSGRVWRKQPGTVLPLPRTSGDQPWDFSTGEPKPSCCLGRSLTRRATASRTQP